MMVPFPPSFETPSLPPSLCTHLVGCPIECRAVFLAHLIDARASSEEVENHLREGGRRQRGGHRQSFLILPSPADCQ